MVPTGSWRVSSAPRVVETPSAPPIKALLSTGYSIDGEAKDILDRGCNGFIQKPFNLKNLSRKVREILDK